MLRILDCHKSPRHLRCYHSRGELALQPDLQIRSLSYFEYKQLIKPKNMPTASLRAPDGFHLPNAMHTCQDQSPQLFQKFGGHPCAAGFTIDPQNLSIAKELMTKALNEQGINLQNNPTINQEVILPIEFESYRNRKEIVWLEESEIDNLLLQEAVAMDPFGQDFPVPNFGFEVDKNTILNKKWLGQEQKHIKLTTKNGICITLFNLETELQNFFLKTNSQKLWIIAKPVTNAWNMKISVELIVDKWNLS